MTPHSRGLGDGKGYSQYLRVDSGHKGRYQRNTEVGAVSAVSSSGPCPEGAVYSIVHTVDCINAKDRPASAGWDKSFILCQPYSVGVQLNILAARFGGNNLDDRHGQWVHHR